MYSLVYRSGLRSGRYSYVPWPAMAGQRDRHHARPRDHPTRGNSGPHHPAQGPQGRPPARGQAPSPRPGPNHLRESGLPPGTGHVLPCPMDPAPLAIHGNRALDLGHHHRPHTIRGRLGHAERPPPPRPQHSLTCGYHAIHRVLSRVGLSPELAYRLPTTDQEVHQIRKLVCEILAAAAEDGKLFLQTSQPTTDHASAPLRADTYTDTTHPTAQSPPIPLPPCCQPGDPHTPTIARTPGPRDTGLPHPPKQQHTPATDPFAGHPPPPPTLDNPHAPTEGSPTPRGTPTPPSGPHTPPAHTPENPGHPPRPPNVAHGTVPPPRTPTHTTSHIAGPRPSQAQKQKTAALHLPSPPLPTRSACQAARSRRAPRAAHPETYSPTTCPPSSLRWPQQKLLPRNQRLPASQRNPRPPKRPLLPRHQPHRRPPPHPPTLPSPPTSSTRPREKPKLRPHTRLPGTPRPPHRRLRDPGSTPGNPPTRHQRTHTSEPRSSSAWKRTSTPNPTPNPS